jgi:PAS domain S-box-containing protein
MENKQIKSGFKDFAEKSLAQVYKQADQFNELLLAVYLAFGIGLSFFYDTWWFAFGTGPLAVMLYVVSKWLMPRGILHHYIMGISYGIFMAQFIYQMHGLFEMHFTVFLASVALISYRNWKVFIPFTLFVVAHHGLFAYLQYSGYPEIRFTQEEFMPLTTFIFHILLAAAIIGLSAYRAYDFRSYTEDVIIKEAELEHKARLSQVNISVASSIAAGELVSRDLEEDDEMGKALMHMQQKLMEAQRREKVEKFVNIGLAEIGDILRKYNNSLEELSTRVITYLVKYLDANQGALFILRDQQNADDDSEQLLEMTACYAYGKKKHVEKLVEPGQGLVGQVYLEKQTMLLTDVPNHYVNITSGLGEATPSSLILVPLKVNEQVEGVIEIASFKIFEDYQVSLIEKISESIASAVSNGKINERTRRLLSQSQQQTEELKAQEEEMRQNNEELQATQEEMIRKETELSGVIEAIDNTFASIEFDCEGNILRANDAFLKTMGYSSEEIHGQHHRIFVLPEESNAPEYVEFWKNLAEGKSVRSEIKRLTKGGQTIWLYASYTPLFDQQGKVFKVLKLAQDISLRKKEEEKIKRLSLVADNTDNSVVITNKEGLIEYVNEGFTRLTGYTANEVIGKKPGKMLQGKDTSQDTVRRIGEKLHKKEPFYEEILNYNKAGESYWISLAVNPVFDQKGNLENFIAIQANITDTKTEAIDYACKMEAISRSNSIVEFDMEGKVITANDSYLNVLGYSLEEIQGITHRHFLKAEDAQSDEYKQLWDDLRSGKVVQGDFRRVSKDGQEVWFRGNFNVVHDINGHPFKIVKIAQDITEVKKLELEAEKQAIEIRENEKKLRKYTMELEELQSNLSDKLQEAKNEMKDQLNELEAEKLKNTAILEGCVDGVLSFNDRGTVDFFNKAAEDIWATSRDEVLGRNINELMPIEFSQDGQGDIHVVHIDSETQVKTDIHIRTEVNIYDKQGEEVTVLLTKSSAKVLGRYSYTFFVQKISVDLF